MRRFHDLELGRMAEVADELEAEMSTTGLLVNPKGAGYFNFVPDNGSLFTSIEVDPEVESALPLGTLVEIETYAGPGSSNPPTVPKCQPSSTTADFYLLGVVVGGQSAYSNSGGAVPPGDIALVMVKGLCQVLFAATTTAGEVVVQSTGTAGCGASTATAVLGKTIGTCLQSVTISSGTGLAWCYISKV